jgi:hypothetical protein
MEKVEAGLRLALAYVEAYNRRDGDLLVELVFSDAVFDDAEPGPNGTLYRGRVALKELWASRFAADPHAVLKVEEVFGHGFRTVLRWRLEGGQTPRRGLDVFQIREGQISQILSYAKR